PAAASTESLRNRTARLLRFQKIMCNGTQPLPMLRRVLQPHQPREAQQHARALDVVHPAPLFLRVSVHRYADGGRGLLQKFRLARPRVRPEVARPEVRFEMRRWIDGCRIVEMFPAELLELRDVDAVAA